MDIDDDDDFYAPEEPTTTTTLPTESAPALDAAGVAHISDAASTEPRHDEDLEEGEEEDEGAEMEDSDSVRDPRLTARHPSSIIHPLTTAGLRTSILSRSARTAPKPLHPRENPP